MSPNTPEVGAILKGRVSGISKFGAFVALDGGISGLVHISEISNDFVQDINDHLKIGQEVNVKVVSIDEKNRLSLSIKKALPQQERPARQTQERKPAYSSPRPAVIEDKPYKQQSFEDMMSKFKQESDERNANSRASKEFRKNDYAKRNKR
jgi:S1 RNA binding domain protein